MVLGTVAFATFEALDGIPGHWAPVGYVAELVTSAAPCEGRTRNPFREGDWFAEHSQVSFLHGLCDGAVFVNEGEGNGGRIASYVFWSSDPCWGQDEM